MIVFHKELLKKDSKLFNIFVSKLCFLTINDERINLT